MAKPYPQLKKKFYIMLKEIDEEYRTTLINFAMTKLMEMEQTDRNKIVLYLFNSINTK